MKLKIPIYSAIFGLLIEKMAYKLYPLYFFKDWKIRITFNEYAMFTGGFIYNNLEDFKKVPSELT